MKQTQFHVGKYACIQIVIGFGVSFVNSATAKAARSSSLVYFIRCTAICQGKDINVTFNEITNQERSLNSYHSVFKHHIRAYKLHTLSKFGIQIPVQS